MTMQHHRTRSERRSHSRKILGVLGTFVLAVTLVAATAPMASASGDDSTEERAEHEYDLEHRWHRPRKPRLVEIQLLGINDYHGHVESTTPGTVNGQAAGGSEYLAAKLNELREGHKNSLTVAAGDLIGGTPAFSGLFHDEPSVETLNAMELDVSSVGNHEFDEGVTELLRMQDGGCHPLDGCYFPDDPYEGADFQWLAANVVDETTGKTALPPYEIKWIGGVRVAFIGMTLEGTDALVSASGIQGWDFRDEVETANALVPKLKRRGVKAIVVLNDGYEADEALAEEIIAFTKGNLPGFKRPKSIDFIVDRDMPLTPTGKILHRVLRERYGTWSDTEDE